ncbi:MAG: 50S ribosomal protein L9 [Hyphomicrobiaceae bacterium hypho_1]
MQIILLERIGSLGQMGDIVNVKNGYARNFLLPKGKALRATSANQTEFEKTRLQLEARNLELKKEAEIIGEKLSGRQFTIIRQAGDTGQLYGSVATRDIARIITEDGVSIDRRQIELRLPIKTLGIHSVQISLHPEVNVSIMINVARSEEEAERQTRGEDVTLIQDEILELETFNPDMEFNAGEEDVLLELDNSTEEK